MASAWSASLYGGLGAKPPEAEDLNSVCMHNSARKFTFNFKLN